MDYVIERDAGTPQAAMLCLVDHDGDVKRITVQHTDDGDAIAGVLRDTLQADYTTQPAPEASCET